jgi:hypothetical protein
LELNYQKVLILETDIPVEALSDLDSDPEDVEEGVLLSTISSAGVGGVSVKWMTQQKGWTSKSVSRLLLYYP